MNNLVFEGKEGGDDVMITLTKSGPTAVVAVSVLVSVAGGSATGLHLYIMYVCVCVFDMELAGHPKKKQSIPFL